MSNPSAEPYRRRERQAKERDHDQATAHSADRSPAGVVTERSAKPATPHADALLNPLVRRVLSSRHLGSHIDRLMLLEFTGRRSGRRIRVPVALHLMDGVPMAFTHRPWRLNFTGGAPVTITHRGQVRQGRGVLLPATPEQVGSALRMALDSGTSPFVLGLKIAPSHEPTTQDLATVGHSLIRFDLETV
jgi:hypothetical protein